jgi:hypothetical protein
MLSTLILFTQLLLAIPEIIYMYQLNFDNNPIEVQMFMSFVIILILFKVFMKYIKNIDLDLTPIHLIILITVYTIFMILSMMLVKNGSSNLYLNIMSRGYGSMTLNSSVELFGDLRHLTDAAQCDKSISVGTIVCDSWSRPLNQNPDIIQIFKFLNLTKSFPLGVIITSVFFFSLILFIWFRKVYGFPTLLFMCSPVLLLALDRGNEIITSILLLIGFILYYNKSLITQFISATAFLVSAVFKFWPTIFLIILAVLSLQRRVWGLILAGLLSFVYWITKQNTLFQMLQVTDSPSLFVISFGFSPIFQVEGNSVLLFSILGYSIFFMAYFLLQSGVFSTKDSFLEILSNDDRKLYFALTLTFVAVWLFGNSYIYRMIILLPIVLTLSQLRYRNIRPVQVMLIICLITVLSSKLPINYSLTFALCIILLLQCFQFIYNNYIKIIKSRLRFFQIRTQPKIF